jgi:hypothetical protein
MDDLPFNVDPYGQYDGPEFEEYCIAEVKYLLASRDRSACASCALSSLCQAGFEEQVRRVMVGENPSLTEGCVFEPEALEPHRLLAGLTPEQRAFVRSKIPNL